LAINVKRLSQQILPLKPDMIISYHGINGFHLLNQGVPPLTGKPPPEFHKRPLTLLADCEYRLRLLHYRQEMMRRLPASPVVFSNLMNSAYGMAYENLIRVGQTNGIRLVLSTFSMSLNGHSTPEAVEFFRPAYPAVRSFIRANEAHSALVRQLVQQHPDVSLVDTQPRLDGDTDKFLDLIHFTQEGDRVMAETFFAGIEEVLKEDVADTKTPNAPR
jgi:lysophospholipase L1-like esterase